MMESLAHRKVLMEIDSYDDCFSEFDSGPPEERLISMDLKHEIENTASNVPKRVSIQVVFRLPASARDAGIEQILKRRIPLEFNYSLKRASDKAKGYFNLAALLFGASLGAIVLLSLFGNPVSEATGFWTRMWTSVLEMLSWLPAVFGVEYLERYIVITRSKLNLLKRLSKITVSFEKQEPRKDLAKPNA